MNKSFRHQAPSDALDGPLLSLDLRWAWVALSSIVLCIPLLVTKADPDLWGHTRFGIDIIETHAIPLVDPYSFTQDRPWINHEWLSEVLMGAAYLVGGTIGLVLLKFLVVSAGFVLIAAGLRAVHPIAVTALVALAIAASPSITGTVRPQIWTFLALIVLVRLLQARRYAWCPVLFAAWVNFHGGWIVGLGVLGTWCAITAFERWRDTARVPWVLVAMPVASFLATIVNPYGWRMWQFLATTVRVTRDISEWRPIYESAGTPWVAFGLVTVLVIVMLVRKDTRPTWAWGGVLAILAYGTIRMARIGPLAAPLAVLIVGPALALWWPRAAWSFKAPSKAAARIVLVPLVLIALTIVPVAAPSFACIAVEGPWIPDTTSGRVLARQAVTGRLVTLFGWGEYAIWHFAPRLLVSLDGRRETVYSDDVLRIHSSVVGGGDEGDAWLTQTRPEYVWLSRSEHARRRWLETNGYRVDVETARAYVAVRADLPRLSTPPTDEVRCFP